MDWIFTQTDFTSPIMLIVALLAVSFVGLAKGGLAGFGILGVPLLALYMPPLQAAALLLPSYLIMDITAVTAWRHYRDWHIIRSMLPAALLGVVLGTVLASVTSDALIKLIVGIVTMAFVLRQAWLGFHGKTHPHAPNAWRARIWGLISGFTSFIAHAGGPPFSVYTMPLRLDPKILTGTAAIYFAVINASKVLPYFILGEFGGKTLASTIVLIPFTILGVLAGAAIVKRMDAKIFYPFTYAMIFLISMKLLWDGFAGL